MRLDLSLATPEYVDAKRKEAEASGAASYFVASSFDKSPVICFIREETKWEFTPRNVSLGSLYVQVDVDTTLTRERLNMLNDMIIVHAGHEYKLDSIDTDSETYEMYDQPHTERWLELNFKRTDA